MLGRRRAVAAAAAVAMLLVGATQAPGEAGSAAVSATTLRVNTQTNPIGLGDATPGAQLAAVRRAPDRL